MRDFDWSALVPDHIAARQVAWERRRRILRACSAGAGVGMIAAAMGLSRGRVSQLRDQAKTQGRSPVEGWIERSGDLAALADVMRTADRVNAAVDVVAVEREAMIAELHTLRGRIARAVAELDRAPDVDWNTAGRKRVREVVQANLFAWTVLTEDRDPPNKRRAEDAP